MKHKSLLQFVLADLSVYGLVAFQGRVAVFKFGLGSTRCPLQAILVYLLVSAAAIPVSSAVLMVFVISTPPEST